MFVNGITVVLCGTATELEGATIAWATKIEKEHVMLSLPADAAVTEAILSRPIFSVSVLGAHQSRIARQYGGRKQARPLPRNKDDLDFARWDVPYVKHSRAHFLCNHTQTIFINEQTVVIAEIIESFSFEEIAPLIYDHTAYFD